MIAHSQYGHVETILKRCKYTKRQSLSWKLHGMQIMWVMSATYATILEIVNWNSISTKFTRAILKSTMYESENEFIILFYIWYQGLKYSACEWFRKMCWNLKYVNSTKIWWTWFEERCVLSYYLFFNNSFLFFIISISSVGEEMFCFKATVCCRYFLCII